MSSELFHCIHLELCGGCPEGKKTYSEQKHLKIKKVEEHFHGVAVQFHTIGLSHIRDRGDFIIDNGQFTLFSHRDDQGMSRRVPIVQCQQLSLKNQALFEQLQTLSWPIQKGSIRLRSSPEGDFNPYEFGVWLDFSNIDIKNLLSERSLLDSLIKKKTFIEIGQKHKTINQNNSNLASSLDLKLAPPELLCWSVTYVGEKIIPLFTPVGGFTQPGTKGNKIIVTIFEEILSSLKSEKIVEFGSGAGNLTFPLAGSERYVRSCEIEALALAGLKKSLSLEVSRELKLPSRIDIREGNFHKIQKGDFFNEIDTIVVNPPRSGIGDFIASLKEIPKKQLPAHFIYMSCFVESMKKDSQLLTELGYKLNRLDLVDQFPQSVHFELIGLWTLNRFS